MFEDLRNDPTVRVLLVIVLGLLILDFLFSLLFGTGNIMYKYLGLTSALIEILVLLMVGAFFYGLYMVFLENAEPFLSQMLLPNQQDIKCKKCGKQLQKAWNCCPICGSDRVNEGHQN